VAVVLVLGGKRLSRRRHRHRCRRHVGVGRRTVRVAAGARRAAMVDLGIGKEVIGWRRLLRPSSAMRHRIGRHMLGHARRSIRGKMRCRLMGALGLDKRHVFAGRRLMRRRVRLTGFARAGAMFACTRSIGAVAGVMIGGARRSEIVSVGIMSGGARNTETVAGIVFVHTPNTQAVAGIMFGRARATETMATDVMLTGARTTEPVAHIMLAGARTTEPVAHVMLTGARSPKAATGVMLAVARSPKAATGVMFAGARRAEVVVFPMLRGGGWAVKIWAAAVVGGTPTGEPMV
jgi:hypothetical protein